MEGLVFSSSVTMRGLLADLERVDHRQSAGGLTCLECPISEHRASLELRLRVLEHEESPVTRRGHDDTALENP